MNITIWTIQAILGARMHFVVYQFVLHYVEVSYSIYQYSG
jgi:hypothetical protein